jgi:hypothetical protein
VGSRIFDSPRLVLGPLSLLSNGYTVIHNMMHTGQKHITTYQWNTEVQQQHQMVCSSTSVGTQSKLPAKARIQENHHNRCPECFIFLLAYYFNIYTVHGYFNNILLISPYAEETKHKTLKLNKHSHFVYIAQCR